MSGSSSSVCPPTWEAICIRQATSDKLLAKDDRFDVQTLSYDPEYSPVLLNFKEFLSHFSGTWQLLNSFLRMESQASNGGISVTELDDKSIREQIRFNTFDFWFCYMYFSQIPLFLILIPICLLGGTIYISSWNLFRFMSNSMRLSPTPI